MSTATTAPPRAMVLSTMLLLGPLGPSTPKPRSSRGPALGQPSRRHRAQIRCGAASPVTEPAAPTYLSAGPLWSFTCVVFTYTWGSGLLAPGQGALRYGR